MNRLKETLKRARMTQQELIAETGLSQASINHYCNNRRQPWHTEIAKSIVDAINRHGYKRATVKSVFPGVRQ